MPRPTSSDCVCCPKAMMSCQARRYRPCVLSKGGICHATPDVAGPCVPSKGYDVMPRPMSFDCVCCLRAVMSFHTRHRPTVCAVLGR